MRVFGTMLVLIGLAAAACSQPLTPSAAKAQQPASQSNELSASDRTAILAGQHLTADAGGLIENECGDKVAPAFTPVELGGAAGTATLLSIGGGPNTATCYGDGPDLHLMVRDGSNWREIYAARGRMLIVLPTTTGGVHDIADGGPGFSFPVWSWSDGVYAPANRSVADSDTANATFYP